MCVNFRPNLSATREIRALEPKNNRNQDTVNNKTNNDSCGPKNTITEQDQTNKYKTFDLKEVTLPVFGSKPEVLTKPEPTVCLTRRDIERMKDPEQENRLILLPDPEPSVIKITGKIREPIICALTPEQMGKIGPEDPTKPTSITRPGPKPTTEPKPTICRTQPRPNIDIKEINKSLKGDKTEESTKPTSITRPGPTTGPKPTICPTQPRPDIDIKGIINNLKGDPEPPVIKITGKIPGRIICALTPEQMGKIGPEDPPKPTSITRPGPKPTTKSLKDDQIEIYTKPEPTICPTQPRPNIDIKEIKNILKP